MILFFRKIRQKLLTQNKFSKYLLYAIGEIALVMIGILLALQVNNRNEEAKNRATEASYLSSLHKDFLSNKEQLSNAFESVEKALSVVDSVNKYNLLMTESNWDQMRKWIDHSFYRPNTFEPITGTMDALLSSGRIELIQNEDLKRLIISWNDLYLEYNKRQDLHIMRLNRFNNFKQRNPDWKAPLVINSVKRQLELAYLFGNRGFILSGLTNIGNHNGSIMPKELMKTIDTFIALTAPANNK